MVDWRFCSTASGVYAKGNGVGDGLEPVVSEGHPAASAPRAGSSRFSARMGYQAERSP